jgi:hypothetical protein
MFPIMASFYATTTLAYNLESKRLFALHHRLGSEFVASLQPSVIGKPCHHSTAVEGLVEEHPQD